MASVAALVTSAVLWSPVVPRADATTAAAPAASSVALRPLRVVARPGFRATRSGPVLNAAQFTRVGAVSVPAATLGRTVVIAARLTVVVPLRIALSVRATCRSGDGRALNDVLVIGQNPVPGSDAVRRASRTLVGRAVVDQPAHLSMTCVLEVSPRTESVTPSWMRLISGTFTARPTVVLARGAQRPALLVGTATSPGSGGHALPSRRVAVVPAVLVPSGRTVRVQGEAELTTCALGYHLCARGTSAPSVVDITLALVETDAAGGVCSRVSGTTARVTITAAVHHVKAVAPVVAHRTGCGSAVSAWLVVTYRGGNAVEVEPTLVPHSVQTLVWVEG